MDDALLVGELQGLANGRDDGQRLSGVKRPRLHRLPQIHPIHEFHEQVEEATRLPEIVNGHDVRMVQRGERLGFAGEALGERRIADALGGQELQRDQPVERFCRAL